MILLKTKKPSLAEAIEQVQAEANALIEQRATELKIQFPGIPISILRASEVTKHDDCACRVAKRLLREQKQ